MNLVTGIEQDYAFAKINEMLNKKKAYNATFYDKKPIDEVSDGKKKGSPTSRYMTKRN